MKAIFKLKWPLLLLIVGAFSVIQCTHDDEIILPPEGDNFVRGEAKVNTQETWNFDKAHSSIRWETLYSDGMGALLTGRFNDFGIDLVFDEANPANSSISAFVVLSSVNTGEPGRDGGCLLGTLGTSEADTAFFHSNSIVYAESGPEFEAQGELIFHGATSDVLLVFEFLGEHFIESSRGDHNLSGFKGKFSFNAKTIHGIESGNIDDVITVMINGQFKEPI